MRNRDDRVVENGIIVQEQKGGDKCKEMSGFFNWHIDFQGKMIACYTHMGYGYDTH